MGLSVTTDGSSWLKLWSHLDGFTFKLWEIRNSDNTTKQLFRANYGLSFLFAYIASAPTQQLLECHSFWMSVVAQVWMSAAI